MYSRERHIFSVLDTINFLLFSFDYCTYLTSCVIKLLPFKFTVWNYFLLCFNFQLTELVVTFCMYILYVYCNVSGLMAVLLLIIIIIIIVIIMKIFLIRCRKTQRLAAFARSCIMAVISGKSVDYSFVLCRNNTTHPSIVDSVLHISFCYYFSLR